MSFVAVTLVLVLAVAFSLPSFLTLLDPQPAATVSPVLATVGTAALGGSLLLLAGILGWPTALAILILAVVFDRLIYTPRSHLARRLGIGSAAALLLIGLAIGGAPEGNALPVPSSAHN